MQDKILKAIAKNRYKMYNFKVENEWKKKLIAPAEGKKEEPNKRDRRGLVVIKSNISEIKMSVNRWKFTSRRQGNFK